MIQRIDHYIRSFSSSSLPFKRMGLLVFVAIITLFGTPRGHASERAFDEFQVKAVFLYRLTLFVTWPERVSASPDQPFVIGILGDDPFGAHIDRVVSNEKSNDRPILVRRYQSIAEVFSAPSQVLFINPALKQKWPQIKRAIESLPMLTVSDMEQFCELGGMINISTQINKIKIAINPDETRMAGLKISSKLLKVSRNVKTDYEGGRR